MSIWGRTPRGIISKAQFHVALSLADSDAFREMTGAIDQAGALDRIHSEHVDCEKDEQGEISLVELDAARPYGQVAAIDSGVVITPASTDSFRCSRDVALFLAANASDLDADDAIALSKFNDLVGLILVEVAANSKTAPYSQISRVALQIAPRTVHPKEQTHLGNYFFALAVVTTGGDA